MAKKSLSKGIPTRAMAQVVDELKTTAESQRKSFERRWYDNNFFDDGKHFRFVSRSTGKIVDLSSRNDLDLPTRAIPKASRQIRGVANLLMQPEYVPVVYPEKVSSSNYPPAQQDPQTGQLIQSPEYLQAMEQSKQSAKRIGHWLQEEWKDQHLTEQLIQMLILSAKHGVSYIQTWADPVAEELKTKVYDAFDIYLIGSLTSIYDSPFIMKGVPMLISEIKANELFDEEQTEKITPDNRYASSEIKQAYMQSRYGHETKSDNAATLLMKEAFMKEYLDDDNWSDAMELSKETGAMEGKKKGDMIMRHTYVAGGLTLHDEYLPLKEYPFADFRYEPGPIYQTPLIERFIPANKTLDIVMSRMERYINTMTVGVYQKRKGENFQITNRAGAQVIEYEQTPLTQMNLQNVPGHVFQFINEINSIIEEQGASTSALNQLPSGVKSGVAIENLKATEFANLKIASMQLKETVRNISERMIELAGEYFQETQTVMRLEDGEPQYFDIIGAKGVEKRRELNRQYPDMFNVPDATVIGSNDVRVDIEVETGLGFTMEGKKSTMQQIINYIQVLAQQGMISTEAIKEITKRFLEVFQYGNTQEFMEAFDKGLSSSQLSQDQLNQMKIAMAEVVKDTGLADQGQPSPEKDQRDIQKVKIGAVEALQDLAGGGGNA